MWVSRTTAPFKRKRKRKRRRSAIKGLRTPALPAALAPKRTRSARHPIRGVRPTPWKLLGLAGLAGVAATGVIVARSRRSHSDLQPDELRERLHRRLAQVGSEPS